MALWVPHRAHADALEQRHMLGVMDDGDDLGHPEFLAQQADHHVRRVPVRRGDERVSPVGTGLLQRLLHRRVVLEHQAVVPLGGLLGPVGVLLDHHHLVPAGGRDLDERRADITRPDDDEVHERGCDRRGINVCCSFPVSERARVRISKGCASS